MNDSKGDPYESGQKSERSNLSDDNESSTHHETDLHDKSDVFPLEAESDWEMFDLTDGENICINIWQKTASNITFLMLPLCLRMLYVCLSKLMILWRISLILMIWNFWKCRIRQNLAGCSWGTEGSERKNPRSQFSTCWSWYNSFFCFGWASNCHFFVWAVC